MTRNVLFQYISDGQEDFDYRFEFFSSTYNTKESFHTRCEEEYHTFLGEFK